MQIERLELATRAVLRLHPHPTRFSFFKVDHYQQISRPIDTGWLVRHVLGDTMVGAVSCDDEGKTTVVGIDLDAHHKDQSPNPAARRFVDAATAWDIPTLVHRSKSGKGYHIRTLFSERVDGYLARCLYLCLANAAQVDIDSAFDKVWPPSQGYGVLALPLNCKYIKDGGCVALDPATFEPIDLTCQIEAILEAKTMDATELTGTLVAMDATTEKLARQIAGSSGRSLNGQEANEGGKDGGLPHMMDNCYAVNRLIEEPLLVHYDFWVGMASNFKPFIGGREVFQSIQQNHYQVDPGSAKYDPRRFEHIWRPLKKPHLCTRLSNAEWTCPNLGVCGCRAPAGLPFWLRKVGIDVS